MDSTVSVVINTLDRASWLAVVLSALRRQNCPAFEIIVINGPSADDTEDVLAAYAGDLRVARCPVRNLAVSRNIGIGMAGGEFIAFLDDDTIPDENWISDLRAGFDDADVAAVGGSVYDYRTNTIQYRVCAVDRLGVPRFDLTRTPLHYPGAALIPYVPGGNAMFRRDALLPIGGFDPQYDYYLDEADVCMRLVDAGYQLKHLANAFVYHVSASGHVRNRAGVVTSWYSVLRNKLYFSFKHAPEAISWRTIINSFQAQADAAGNGLRQGLEAGLVTQEEIEGFQQDVRRARGDGILAGLCPCPETTAPQLRHTAPPTCFRRFPTLLPAGEKLHVCLLSQGYLPECPGGIPRLNYELACGLAALGHTVHVLTKTGTPDDSIRYEENVWVHRLGCRQNDVPAGDSAGFEPALWRHSRRLLDEVRAIHRRHPVDLVEGPIWDFEGLATVLSGEFCTVTNLETPLKMALLTNPEWDDGSPATRAYFDSIVKGEAAVTTGAAAVRAISHGILHTMKSLYRIDLDPERVAVTPLGVKDRWPQSRGAARKNGQGVEILFVGRFETRKGIDVLLETIPRLASRFREVRFTLAGGDSPAAGALAARFRDRHPDLAACVAFPGKVSEQVLDELLAACDIFVAPSRYESFGLVYLDAMMFAKPVVACDAGAIGEIVQDGVNGLLAKPGDVESLCACLAALIEAPALRAQYGARGRELFLAEYTRERFVARTLEFYRQVLRRWKEAGSACFA